jgi:hypothetical protein
VRILVPERGDPTTKIGLFILFCISRITPRRREVGHEASWLLGPDVHLLQLETDRDRVLVKHTDRIERQFVEVFACEFD